MRVVHVCEALGGGMISAIASMVDATPEIDHHLLARHRPGCDTGVDLGEVFTSVTELPANPVQAGRCLRRQLVGLFPDVVHAHSSFAGLLTRLVPLGGTPLIYSPHCFAVERRDISPMARRLYSSVERSLATRTDLLLAVAPHELALARQLGYERAVYAVNRANLALEPTATFRTPLRIVTAGRVCAQKDPDHFIHVKRYVESELGVQAEWEWLGGGNQLDEDRLRSAGVKVSGWLQQHELIERMVSAQVYLHTAAWEASPIAVLEAANLGLPLVLRAIPALESLALPGICHDVVATGRRITALRDRQRWRQAHDESIQVAGRHSRQVQGEQLRAAYRRVTRNAERRRERPAPPRARARPAQAVVDGRAAAGPGSAAGAR